MSVYWNRLIFDNTRNRTECLSRTRFVHNPDDFDDVMGGSFHPAVVKNRTLDSRHVRARMLLEIP